MNAAWPRKKIKSREVGAADKYEPQPLYGARHAPMPDIAIPPWTFDVVSKPRVKDQARGTCPVLCARRSCNMQFISVHTRSTQVSVPLAFFTGAELSDQRYLPASIPLSHISASPSTSTTLQSASSTSPVQSSRSRVQATAPLSFTARSYLPSVDILACPGLLEKLHKSRKNTVTISWSFGYAVLWKDKLV